MKKNKKKKRLRVGRLIFLLLILALIIYMLVRYVKVPIRSVTIKGNKNLTDQEILEIAKIDNYPSIFEVTSISIKNKLEKNFYIESAKVRKGLLDIKIDVTESKALYLDLESGDKVSKTGSIKDDKELCIPFLMNEVPSNKKEDFIKAMDKIDSDILCKMSYIKYDPNDIDKDRYYVSMNDGNSVYLTVNKFKKINKYDSILENIGKQNGTLYLDYGDYFEMK